MTAGALSTEPSLLLRPRRWEDKFVTENSMSKPLDFFTYQNGSLSADDVALSEVADLIGTPVYVYSANAFQAPLRELQKGLKGIDHLICFAVKSNSNIAILKLLAEAGAGMDLVSGGELYRAQAAGVPGDRIVFSGVGKTPGEIAAALQYERNGIFSFNVESVPELEMINAVAQDLGVTARIALRFNPDIDAKTHPYISTGLKKNKFGMNRREILEVARAIREEPEHFSGLKIEGISIHIGSQLLSLAPLKASFIKLRELVDELEEILPEPLRFLDVGGGVGITYKNEKPFPISKYCALVHQYFGAKSKLKHPKRILLEPGRMIAGNAGILLSSVLYRKERKEKDFLVIDAAMNDLLRPSLYGSYHDIVPVLKSQPREKTRKADVVGPVCETGDCLAMDRKLGAGLGSGDLLAILSAGAYGFTMASNYNSRPRPPEVLLDRGKIRLIRDREDYDDLLRGEHL
jgi:diaminopimelate decarboxylase